MPSNISEQAMNSIIESSSGNFGISLAMIGAIKGYRVIVLVDPKVTPTNYAVMKAYGAEVIVVHEKDDCGSYHKTRIALARYEGFLSGGSTGAVGIVALKYARKLGAGRNIVCISSDSGERYLTTIYNDEYMAEHAFPVEESVEEIRHRAQRLSKYSAFPPETANDKPGLAGELGSIYAN